MLTKEVMNNDADASAQGRPKTMRRNSLFTGELKWQE